MADAAYVARLAGLTEPFGITHTGVAPADVLGHARDALRHRIDHGLVDGMQFTFKNPERSTDPQRAVLGARSVFVAARPYLLAEPASPNDASPNDASPNDVSPNDARPNDGPLGRVAKYAWADHYAPLREGLWAVAHQLRRDGWKAVAFADDNSIVDREIAHLAGIGWYGKNANLLVQGAGSFFVLGCVVTTAPLPVAAEPVADGCGSCRRCLDGCPTGAIIEPGVIDAARCLAWVLQKPGIVPRHLRSAIGDRLYGCDDCQDVCPPAVRLGVRRASSALAGIAQTPRSHVSVLALLDADDQEVLAHWGRWYLADRDPCWIRRNALLVLGNIGDGGDGDVQLVMADYLCHHDPLLRAHAVWAARRLGLHHLMPATDPHPDVAAELAAR